MDGSLNLTEFLTDWSSGKSEALDEIVPRVEKELRHLAHNFMRRERSGHLLQTTALVNETFLKLADQRSIKWQNRSHFFALSAKLMRRILLNHAREFLAQKRGNGAIHVSLDNATGLTDEKSAEILALNEALERLAEFDKLKSQIVEMRYFGGMTIEETAKALNLAPITDSVHWRLTKAWLGKEIRGENQESKQGH